MQTPWRGLLRHAEAVVTLITVRIAVAVLPPRAVTALLGPVAGTPPVDSAPPNAFLGDASEAARTIPDTLVRAARWLPWRSNCLVLAVAGRLMFARRHIPSAIHLGVRSSHGFFAAHAWLIAYGVIVLGGEEVDRYVPLASFGRTTK